MENATAYEAHIEYHGVHVPSVCSVARFCRSDLVRRKQQFRHHAPPGDDLVAVEYVSWSSGLCRSIVCPGLQTFWFKKEETDEGQLCSGGLLVSCKLSLNSMTHVSSSASNPSSTSPSRHTQSSNPLLRSAPGRGSLYQLKLVFFDCASVKSCL